jgi:hypothetical protein
MTPENFVYWIQGYIELTKAYENDLGMTEKQVKCIEDHVNLVLKKETPNRTSDSFPVGTLLNYDQVTDEFSPSLRCDLEVYNVGVENSC